MVAFSEDNQRLRFGRLLKLGAFHICLGLLLMALGCYEMKLALDNYEKSIEVCDKIDSDGEPYFPCKNWDLSRVIGSTGYAIWAGLWGLVTGILGVRVGRCRSKTKESKPLMDAVHKMVAFVGAVLFAPIVISLSVAELVKSPFGQRNSRGFPEIKWIVPLLCGILGFVQLFGAVASASCSYYHPKAKQKDLPHGRSRRGTHISMTEYQ